MTFGDPLRGVLEPQERRRVRHAARVAAFSPLLAVAVPVAGPVVDLVVWWRLTMPASAIRATADRGRSGWIRLLTLGLAVMAALLLVSSAFAIGIVEFGWFRLRVSGEIAEAAIVVGVSLAAVCWSFRHAFACWLLLRSGIHRAARAGPGLAMSAVGAPVLAMSGIGLVVGGVLVLHIALFPPACLLLPLWCGAMVVWFVFTAASLWRIADAVR